MTTKKGNCCCMANDVSTKAKATEKAEQVTREQAAPLVAAEKHGSCCGGETAAGSSPNAAVRPSCCS